MNCDLDLRLSQPPATTSDCLNPQQLTVFYNGGICVRDVTEIQARAIIWQASKEMEQGRYIHRKISAIGNAYKSPPISPASSNASPSSSTGGLSMKKSLQSFLQKRKHRQLATSPYGYGCNVNRRDSY